MSVMFVTSVMSAGLCQALAELLAEVGEERVITRLGPKSFQKSDIAHMALDRQIGQDLGILAEQPPFFFFSACPSNIVAIIAAARAQEKVQQHQRAQGERTDRNADRQIGPRDLRQPFCNFAHRRTHSKPVLRILLYA